MKRLILVRHANAESTGESGDDFGRRLTEIGRKEAVGLGTRLAAVGTALDIIVCSPAVRAVETAGIIAGILGYAAPNVRQNRSIYKNPAPQDFLNILDDFDDDHTTALLIGHNPSLSEFAWHLCSKFHDKMKPASAVAIEFNKADWSSIIPGRGKLLFYLTPDYGIADRAR